MEEYFESSKTKTFGKWIDLVPTTMADLKSKSKQYSELLKSVDVHFSTVENRMEETFHKMRNLLDLKHKTAKEELQSKRNEQTRLLVSFQDKLHENLQSLDYQNQLIQSAISSSIPISDWTKLEQKLKESLSK